MLQFNLGTALTCTELLTGLAVYLQSLEHFRLPGSIRLKSLMALRAFFAIALCGLGALSLVHEVLEPGSIVGSASPSLALINISLFICTAMSIRRWGGPFNGGSDNMTLLILFCLSIARLPLSVVVVESVASYLALQLVLSYFVAGVVKIRSPHWWNGQMMTWLFTKSIYQVPKPMKEMAKHSHLMRSLGRATLFFEVLFPISLVHPATLMIALVAAFLFHFGNAVVLGLNRFFWIWIAAFPVLIWFQQRWISSAI